MYNIQYINIIRSVRQEITKSEYADMYDTAVKYENKLIHGHDFFTVGLKETNSYFVRCITCGEYYFDTFSKTLQKKSR
jgi:hypothetical protein